MALIPPNYLRTVVSVELQKPDGQYVCIGTGFLFGEQIEEGKYIPFLVTAKHVLLGKEKVSLRFDATEGLKRIEVLLKGENSTMVLFHDIVDVAIVPMRNLEGSGIQNIIFRSDKDVAEARSFSQQNITLGDSVFVLGFPFGLSGNISNRVIVKQGNIARVDEETLANHTIIINCDAFPGNSGGPVITKPEIVSIIGTAPNSQSLLVGLVSEYLMYSDVAVSKQTGIDRIVFQEHSGLVNIVPIEYVKELTKRFVNSMKVISLKKPDDPLPVDVKHEEVKK